MSASSPVKTVVGLMAMGAVAVRALYINGSTIAPCDSPIYCHGEILRQVELARPYGDSKTFVDMPAIRPLDDIQQAFDQLEKPLSNNSALNDFLNTYFAQAGGELRPVPRDQLRTDPVFLNNVSDPVIREFVERVIDIWPDLSRSYAGSVANCSGCPSSFIPIRRPFVVAGGRFREPYYWDSYWIVEGLLRTGGSFTEMARNIIENFLDLVEQFGFVPNGARVYYLNRSQPPMLSHMVRAYIERTNDTEILQRALPLLVREHQFWMTNRTVDITGPDGQTYSLNRYAVQNTQPRPESYREDYETATNRSFYARSGIIYPQTVALDPDRLAGLYADLATGAESGWDFTSRWMSTPADAVNDVYFPLRSLNTRDTVPVCLNSILYGNEMVIGGFYRLLDNATAARDWDERAARRSEAMYALMWNETLVSYFDYNITSSSQNRYAPADADAAADEIDTRLAPPGQQVFFHVAQFYPFWMGAAPDSLKRNPFAVRAAFARVARYLERRSGGIPATNLRTGEQWDQPNVWPPLMHALMQGLLNTPPTFGSQDPAYRDLRSMALTLAQRYLDSTFCTWYATGGSTSQTPQLPGLTESDIGIMFEKYDDNSTNVAGGGGEYEVVEGFGWTNGVLIWAVDTFRNDLRRPDCGNITAARVRSGGEPGPARKIKRFGRSSRQPMA